MNSWSVSAAASLVLGGLLVFGLAAPSGAACRGPTPEWRGMATAELRLGGRTIPARIADDLAERVAGMQWLCPEQMEAWPILFLFPRPERNFFHMRNVVAPLDIAFLDTRGRVLSVHRLEPDQQVDTGVEVAAALEAAAGSFARWGLEPGMRVEWTTGSTR